MLKLFWNQDASKSYITADVVLWKENNQGLSMKLSSWNFPSPLYVLCRNIFQNSNFPFFFFCGKFMMTWYLLKEWEVYGFFFLTTNIHMYETQTRFLWTRFRTLNLVLFEIWKNPYSRGLFQDVHNQWKPENILKKKSHEGKIVAFWGPARAVAIVGGRAGGAAGGVGNKQSEVLTSCAHSGFARFLLRLPNLLTIKRVQLIGPSVLRKAFFFLLGRGVERGWKERWNIFECALKLLWRQRSSGGGAEIWRE